MELDLQSLFGLLCTGVLIGWNPATAPAFGLIYEGAIGQWSAKKETSLRVNETNLPWDVLNTDVLLMWWRNHIWSVESTLWEVGKPALFDMFILTTLCSGSHHASPSLTYCSVPAFPSIFEKRSLVWLGFETSLKKTKENTHVWGTNAACKATILLLIIMCAIGMKK
jgi:hypothetical protein